MGHTNTTPNYNLPQFLGSDKPAWLTDVNNAMSAIDTAIAAAKAAADNAGGAAAALATTVGGHTTQLETLSGTVANQGASIVSQGNAINTISSLIGNGEPTTQDKTIIGAINELAAEIPAGGDVSVRYNDGYIQYSPDGGTTWINLINVSTPVQLLPVMTSDTSLVGNASTNSTSGISAYLSIDGSEADIENCVRLGSDGDYVEFEFTNAQYVTSIKCAYKQRDGYAQLRLDHSADGTTWIAGTPVTVADANEHTLTEYVNNTIKAVRIYKVGQTGSIYGGKLEAYN